MSDIYALTHKMQDIADELGEIGYEILAESIRFAAESIEINPPY